MHIYKSHIVILNREKKSSQKKFEGDDSEQFFNAVRASANNWAYIFVCTRDSLLSNFDPSQVEHLIPQTRYTKKHMG